MASEKMCMNAEEVAEMTGLSVSLIRRMTRYGHIPHLRLGRRILYPTAAINSWISENTSYSSSTEDGENVG